MHRRYISAEITANAPLSIPPVCNVNSVKNVNVSRKKLNIKTLACRSCFCAIDAYNSMHPVENSNRPNIISDVCEPRIAPTAVPDTIPLENAVCNPPITRYKDMKFSTAKIARSRYSLLSAGNFMSQFYRQCLITATNMKSPQIQYNYTISGVLITSLLWLWHRHWTLVWVLWLGVWVREIWQVTLSALATLTLIWSSSH